MLLENKKVAIIGGGPGGLTLARLLQLKGVNVKVYERDLTKDVRVQGATLDLHYDSGLKAIENAGLSEAFKKAYRPGAEKGRVVDQYGNIVYDEHSNASDKSFDNELFRPEIDRGDLRDILLESLKPDTVVWNCHLVTLSQNSDGWKLEFKNGSTGSADILIGADGANSKIRSVVTTIRPFYAGITIFQGNVEDAQIKAPTIYTLLKGGKIYVHSGGKYLHVSSKGDGSIDFYMSSQLDENWVKNSGIDFTDRSQLMEWCQKVLAGWADIWFELFENVSLPLLIRPQYCVPLDQTWEAHSTITLLGDAAHIMPPSGEGVNLAMLDALELSECVTSGDFKSVQSAIAAYEKQMQVRGLAEAQASLEMVQWMHGEGAMEKMVQLLSEMPNG
ncbi:NAD(P)/FAD-dependent oxidoreductase [Cytophagaceae bacterium YF14B1]|uniref:Flavin-dependent monooxygenase n=1 Tax=Xanthocytophaga flava TaxID=3048013 RepID=A0AAE3QMV9_9BACT|nr:NAD(P)/FAD-dependent oxidoreductase [Xanthocytophaga flavus]MDJ1481950.1 NAD(P)/FAD-dependent oxidoreductase [Xanthocytophaga flavus]